MKIVFEPSKSATNKYANIMVSILKSNGHEVYGLAEWFKRPSLWFKVKVIHLNWFENIIGRSNVGLITQFAKQSGKLLFMKLLGRKIIWTMHNKTEHEKKENRFNLSIRLCQLILKHSHCILIHCDATREILMNEYGIDAGKIRYCPHPNYINQYGPILRENLSNPQKRELRLLFLGAIRPYKNIELLIEAIREINIQSIQLTIAGMPLNKSYEEKLRDKASGIKNIQLQFRFINDTEIPSLLSMADVLVLPYELRSSLNSGTIFLAFSYQKTVISPEIGTVMDLQETKEKIFHYNYNTPAEHKQALKRMIEQTYSLFVQEKDTLNNYGKNLYKYVAEVHHDQKIFEALHQIYTS